MSRMPGPRYSNGHSSPRPPFADQLNALNASAAAGLPLIGQPSPPPIPPIQFDGFEFAATDFLNGLPIFDLAYRARRGDSSAIATLQATAAIGFGIRDIHKRMYWPVEAGTMDGPVESEPISVEPHPLASPD